MKSDYWEFPVAKQLVLFIVDDDEISQFILERAVKSNDLVKTLLKFPDGTPALEFIINNLEREHQLPDIIFLDINMPLMDGWRFLEEFAQLQQRLPKTITIFMVSSSHDPIDIQRSLQIDAVADYLTKPIDFDKIDEIMISLSE